MGGECVSDMAALQNQPELFADVASVATTWRAVGEIDGAVLDKLRAARALARSQMWSGALIPDEVILDIDAALVTVHSDHKEKAEANYKGGYGFHPLFCFADHSGEALAANLRPELDVTLENWPKGTRAICRREKPHPGARLRLWDTNGYRHQITLTNSDGDALALELRQRRHARVENAIKNLRDTGLDRLPFRSFAANQAWLDLVATGADLLAWLRLGCLEGKLAKATPKTLRYRLLHVGARLLRKARRMVLRLPAEWPWAAELVGAYRRVAALGT
ncbi:MAG: transposase [Acidimicrobiales bacterium]